MKGSPPRMRGQVVIVQIDATAHRITPADAGTSSARQDSALRSADHPRGCGDKFEIAHVLPQVFGSPPRMRGQGFVPPYPSLHNGITPADAGTSAGGQTSRTSGTDHPRGCGDKSPSLRSVLRALGSPPRMRGQAKQPRLACSLTRITPADAGTSGGLECVRWCHADHPRGCGDKWSHWFHGLNTTGSPPRMRGQAF